MTSELSNDNEGFGRGTGGPDAHGQAAILLVESLIHGLIARQVISVADAVEILDTAAEVEADIAADPGSTPPTRHQSREILGSISSSLRHDLGGE